MKKIKNNFSIVTMLLVTALLMAVLLPGCTDTSSTTPTPSGDLTGCTIEVKSVGGKALEGVGMYIYKDAAMTEMVDYVRTNAQGIAATSNPVPVGSIAVLDKIPAGYVAEESYTITTAQTKITLETKLLEQMGPITLGEVMFDFSVTDINGDTHTLSQLLETKKAVVINLWFVNCNPCRDEFPYLNEAYNNYSDVLEVLAINPEGDNEEEIAEFVAEYGLSFPAIRGDEAWRSTIAALSYPTTIVIDRFGAVGMIHTGSVEGTKVFEDIFAYFTADDYVQSTIADIADVPGEPTAELGSQSNPQEFAGVTDIQITIKPGADYYCNIYRVSGMELRAASQTLKVTLGETVAESVDGEVMMKMPATMNPSAPFEMCFSNTGTEEETYNITFSYPRGTIENPLSLKLGEVSVDVEKDNAQGVYMTYSVQQSGTLVLKGLKQNSGYNVALYNLSTSVQNTLEEDAVTEDGELVLKLPVTMGNKIQVVVSSNVDNAGNYPAVKVTFTAQVEKKAVVEDDPGTDDPNPDTPGSDEPNYNGTLVNPETPEEQYGFVDFTVQVGVGEKKWVSLIRTIGETTLCIFDKDAYVVYKGETYLPTDGAIYIPMKSEGSFKTLELEIGNSGKTEKTFAVTFLFAEGTQENPGEIKIGDNEIHCEKDNDQGTFYSYEVKKTGTLTLTIKSVNPSSVVVKIKISDMRTIPTVVELEEGATEISMKLTAGTVAEIVFSTQDPKKEWKIPEADIVITASFA